jgi:hypothetical protein
VFSANFVGGKPRAALDRAKEFLSVAQSQTESGPLLLGHRMVSTALFTIGDYPAVFSHAERAVALYVPEEHRALAFRFGQDIGVSAYCYFTLALWHLGYPDRANNAARETLHRLRGDLLGRLPSPDWTEMEASFRSALAVAREQGTRGFELRAAVSLARLLSSQGRREEASDLLSPVYGWFTEGFGTPDLKEAKALLDELL